MVVVPNIRMDKYVYNNIIKFFSQKQDLFSAQYYFQEMIKRGIRNSRTFSEMMNLAIKVNNIPIAVSIYKEIANGKFNIDI